MFENVIACFLEIRLLASCCCPILQRTNGGTADIGVCKATSDSICMPLASVPAIRVSVADPLHQ